MGRWQAFVQRYCGKHAVMALFLLCALPVVVTTALVTPPSESPDEVTHYARALSLLHGAIIGVKTTEIDKNTGKPQWKTGLKVNAGMLLAAYGHQTPFGYRVVVTQDDWNKSEAVAPDSAMFYASLPNTATYFPAAYVPGALGAVVSKWFGATPFHSFITARLCMAVAFVLTGLAALYVTAFGEAVLVTVLLLPMTLFLAGTMNQDGVLVAMTCLAAACLTRAGQTQAARGWRIAGLIIFALVLGAKPPYIFLMGVFALPLFAPGFWRRFAEMLLAMLPVLGWIAIISLFVVVPYGKPPYHPGPLFTGDHAIVLDHADAAAQLHILMERPIRFLVMPLRSTWEYAYADYVTVLGVLGPLRILLEDGVYNGWACGLVFAAFGLLLTRRPDFTPPLRALVNFIAIMAAILATYYVLEITFYLDWTEVGAKLIDGIQGRYALIALPFVMFAIPHISAVPGLGRVRFALPPLLLAAPSLAMGVYDIGYIPQKLVLYYYLH
jgi:uncharacterized membrane protein